jgi:hypothetical protein
LRNVVLAPRPSSTAVREALLRSLERFPATIEEVAAGQRATRLRALAADAGVEWIAIVDGDVTLAAEAFGALRRAAGAQTAIVGGRALVGASQRCGAMFGPPRSGPDPFVLVPLLGTEADGHFTELVRGPVDVPQRGAIVVSAAFVRSLPAIALDPVTLHLDLAVQARAAGYNVVCEPSLTFVAGEDSIELRRSLLGLRRYAGLASWNPLELHREPERLRSAFVTREVRVMGNIRGYVRQPYPPLDVLVTAVDEMSRARAKRAGTKLAVNGKAAVCDASNGGALRRALARTSDRYLLVADAAALPDWAGVAALAERLERGGRVAIALEHSEPPHTTALFHCGRIVNAASLRGATVGEVIADAVDRLPQRRLFAAGPGGEIVPRRLPPLPSVERLDVVFVASCKPAATQQTLEALMGEPIDGTIAAVYASGSTTTERLFSVHAAIRLTPDDSDVQLAVGLNRALGACTADAVAIVRDDMQLPHGVLERLRDAFRRIARLGVAVPRIGGADRPESMLDLGYRNLAEMQTLYDRRAELFARESRLLDVATAPVMIVRREVLDLVGGFDEAFGFSRFGIEDFTRRVRAANFLVACCDDAYAHLFPVEDAGSVVGDLDAAPFLRAVYEKRWSSPRGFDPRRDPVPLRRDAGRPAAAETRRVRVLLPLHDEAEWRGVRPLLLEFAAAFRVADPIEVAVGLDGTFELQTAVSELREVLIASGVAMDETLTVNVDIVADIGVWRDAGTNNVRLAGLERESLLDLPIVDSADAIRAFLSGSPA